jgi:hypothetical protein
MSADLRRCQLNPQAAVHFSRVVPLEKLMHDLAIMMLVLCEIVGQHKNIDCSELRPISNSTVLYNSSFHCDSIFSVSHPSAVDSREDVE